MEDKAHLRIDLVSDVVCPWCIVGYKKLEKALALVADKVDVELHWHPFELNPQMPRGGQDLREHLVEKYGITHEDSVRARANLTDIGASLGFEFDYFEGMRMYNTFDAHRLLHHAREFQREHALKQRLFSAFFSERKVLDDIDVLVGEAIAVGLDEAEARAVLEEGRYEDEVRRETHEWMARGVRAVPTFVFDGRFGLSGAQEPELLAEAILKAVEAREQGATG